MGREAVDTLSDVRRRALLGAPGGTVAHRSFDPLGGCAAPARTTPSPQPRKAAVNIYTIDDAETDLRAALDAADHDTIKRLEKVIDDLDAHRDPPALGNAALWYAQQGLKVFPLSPGTKIPFKGTGGCLDATNDPDMVRKWWFEGNPDANIGIATGHLVDVIDIDGPLGQRSRADHWDMLDKLNVIGKVSTPRPGGMHLYVPATGKGNKAGLLPGIDYRGAGGYVVAPPSTNPQGRYLWLAPLAITTGSDVA